METEIFDDLRQFIEAAKKVSEWREIKGADWNLEIGALKEARDHTNSRAIFYAVRPFVWCEKFPKVSRTTRELRERVVNQYKDILPFP